MKKNIICISFQIVILSISLMSEAQIQSAGIRILSESKLIFREDEMLKKIVDDVYFENIDLLRDKVVAQIKTDIKSLTNQTSRAEKVTLSTNTSLNVVDKGGKPYLRYIINGNNIDFSVTTPDISLIPGVGLSKRLDPNVNLLFDIVADIPLIQSGTAESIKFLKPIWIINFKRWGGERLNLLSITKEDLDYWVNGLLETSFYPIYVSLNHVSGRLSDYIASTVVANPALLKEFGIDETRQLIAKVDPGNSLLVFIHNHSQTGMVKRASSDKASTVLGEAKSTPAKPAYNNTAADALKGPKAGGVNNKVVTPVRKNH